MFACNKCGLCCKNIGKNLLYEKLNRGDGTSIFFDNNSNLCTIYEKRPLICNTDKAYKQLFSEFMSRDEYDRRNYISCERLKKNNTVKANT